MVADNRETLPRTIQAAERLQYGNQINYQQALQVREKLQEEIEEDEREMFKKLPALYERVGVKDLDDAMIIETNDDQFVRCFMAPAATKMATESCRPMLFLDGCHTKSRYRMTLLTACTIDGNERVLPIAWGLVPIENSDHWTFFLEALKEYLFNLQPSGAGFVIMSDRDKGLDGVVRDVLPKAHHLHCCQHLAANVQKHFGLACRQNVLECGKSPYKGTV